MEPVQREELDDWADELVTQLQMVRRMRAEAAARARDRRNGAGWGWLDGRDPETGAHLPGSV